HSRQRQQLPLTGGKIAAALPRLSVKGSRQPLNKTIRVGKSGRLLNSVQRNRGVSEGQVGTHIPRKEKDILQDNPDVLAQRLQVPLAHVHAADFDGAPLDVVEAVEQLNSGVVAGARGPAPGYFSPRALLT